jgi:hypothetical protein
MPEFVSREQFLAQKKLATREITTALGLLRIREPATHEFEQFDRDAPLYSVRLICEFAIDAKGGRLFRPEDMSRLAALGTSKIEPIALAILDLAGLTKKAIEDTEKNSRTIPSGDSASA